MINKINLQDIKGKKLFVATPMYGNQCSGNYFNSCLKLQRFFLELGIEIKFYGIFNESLITRARNHCVDVFLQSGYTHLMFIDADIEFDPADVLKMLSMDKGIVCGPYPKKTIVWERIVDLVKSGLVEKYKDPNILENFTGDFAFSAISSEQEFKVDEPIEVKESGTGFMMISREVLEKYIEAYPEFKYRPDTIFDLETSRDIINKENRKIYAIFDTEINPDTKRYLSEDYMFCKNARNMGLKVWLCPWIKLRHIGSYIFSGNLPSLLAES